ncbi:MAG: tRNA pseudouridine(55) synthase TruB [Candidatus Kerfeldbacteria bacterium]|nr:tRNA pseudouridine(55) synthase TruB [Candidatus Kerfeldbacteria bacterium]
MKNLVAIYKPKGPTSHDVVDAVRRATGVKKVGHAGTLDPLARGVLVVAIGREATKLLSVTVQKDKEYVAIIRLGTTSHTDDAEGLLTKTPKPFSRPSPGEVTPVVMKYKGTFAQIPPAFSAVKNKGLKAYFLARAGKIPVLKPRAVTIYDIEILDYTWPDLRLRVHCGPGVYIRSLARDIGSALGTGGYLADLERTRVGEWTSERALQYDTIDITLPPLISDNNTEK